MLPLVALAASTALSAVHRLLPHCPVPLVYRRLQPKPSFRCTPIQSARRWPDSANGTATAASVVLTNQGYFKQLLDHLDSWDEFLLSSGAQVTSLIIQADRNQFARSDITAGFANHSVRAAPECLPAQLGRDGQWTAHLTTRNNLVLVLIREIWVPQVAVSLARAAEVRPPGYGGCHPRQKAEYSIGTKWYGYEMLVLAALSYFDFALKVDCDTSFRAPLQPTPAEAMLQHGAYYMHTGKVFNTNPRCDATIDQAAISFMRSAECADGLVKRRNLERRVQWGSCFVGGWLGLLQSPQVLAYAQFWWAWPGGWLHRWGDQELWPLMLDVVNESHRVVNAADLRRTSIKSGCPYVRPDARERAVTKEYGAQWANLELGEPRMGEPRVALQDRGGSPENPDRRSILD